MDAKLSHKSVFYMMNNFILVVLAFVLTACNQQQVKESDAIVGRWKIYKTNIGGKDISKSSDPTFENGIEFKKDGTFYRFFRIINYNY